MAGRWKIPLTERFGNGYVYSSAFCSAGRGRDASCARRLGLLDSRTPARHLKMKIGRVTKHWNRNCLAVGLSQGFIEPLEATALLFIQQTAAAFVDFLEAGDLSEAAHDRFNAEGERALRGHARLHRHPLQDQHPHRHRVLARECGEPRIFRSRCRSLFNLDVGQEHRAGRSASRHLGKGYPVFSWYCIIAGMGIFPGPARAALAQGPGDCLPDERYR